MIKILFKDLERSELAKETVFERMADVIQRFPDLELSKVTITLSMQNSPTQSGPDLFTVKFRCQSGRFKGVIMERSSTTLYKALADLSEGLLERLNRFGDKERVRKIQQARRVRRSVLSAEPDFASSGS